MAETCPTRDDVAAFCFGRIGAVPFDEIDEHLKNCSFCQAVADDVERQPDPLVDRLRRLKAHAPLPDDANLAQIITRTRTSACKNNSFGPYQILEKIGEGGMGAVFKAKHPTLARLVAIKTVTADCVRKFDDALARFDREIRTLTMLDHPNIAQIYDRGEHGGLPYFVMEYVEGQTLKDILKHSGKLPVAEACEITRQTAVGLQEIHNAGVVHRDIKPGNLMLSAKGLKILDVGLARGETDNDLTTTGHGMGTPFYMAPEQFENAKAVGARADLFSLGRTLVHLLVGRLPEQNILDSVQPPTHLPKELKAVIQKMLSRRPEDRPSSASEVAKQLEPFSRGADLAKLLSSVAQRAPAAKTTDIPAKSTANGLRQTTLGQTPPIRKILPWVIFGALFAILAVCGVGAFLAAGLVIGQASKGTLKITFSTDMPANVQIVANGETVVLKRLSGTKGEVHLAAGKREIEVHSGENILHKETVLIVRNQTAEMTVEVPSQAFVSVFEEEGGDSNTKVKTLLDEDFKKALANGGELPDGWTGDAFRIVKDTTHNRAALESGKSDSIQHVQLPGVSIKGSFSFEGDYWARYTNPAYFYSIEFENSKTKARKVVTIAGSGYITIEKDRYDGPPNHSSNQINQFRVIREKNKLKVWLNKSIVATKTITDAEMAQEYDSIRIGFPALTGEYARIYHLRLVTTTSDLDLNNPIRGK